MQDLFKASKQAKVNHLIRLRPYQIEMKQQIYTAWQEGHKNVLLVLPTGLGKAVILCTIAAEKAKENLPVAIQVHRKELVQQLCLTLSSMGLNHNIIAPRPVILGIVAAQRALYKRQFYDYNSTITVLSTDTLNARFLKHEKWAKSIRLWITDEAAHVLKANKWGRAIEYFPGAIGLGVTATPQRLDKRGLGKHADGVFDVMVEGPNSRWGIENSFLSKYKIAVPESNYHQYLKKATEGSDYSKEAMAYAASESHIVGDAVKNYLKFASGKQAIYFADCIETGCKMEAKFREAGVSAKLLTGETNDKERLNALIDYRDKRTQVLLNVDLFDEGLDVPGIEVVGMCRPTMSLSKYLQQIGRGLRPLEGKTHLILIDHVGNVKRHGLPDTPRRWTLDRIVKRRDRTNLIRICENIMCNSPFDRILTECPYCGTAVSRASGSEGGKSPLEMVDGDLVLLDDATLKAMFENAELESPEDMRARVAHVAGKPAGIRAFKNQQERIETQKLLVEAIANWAGKMKHQGLSDRSINKKYYLELGKSITESLSEPRAAMLLTIEELEGYR